MALKRTKSGDFTYENRSFRGIAPGGGRTHNLWLRRPTLYPVELRAQQTAIIIRRFYNHKRAGLLFAELGPK